MKTIKYHIPVLTCLLLCGALDAQVAIDPVKNVYKIGGSSEIFISYSDGTNAKYGVLEDPLLEHHPMGGLRKEALPWHAHTLLYTVLLSFGLLVAPWQFFVPND